MNDMGRMWGSSRFMSPEEFTFDATLDEITNVYTLGAFAFAMFANYDRSPESWLLNKKTYVVASKAISDNPDYRQQSIRKFIDQWEAAL